MIGTGLLASPVLGGSAAYAVGEALLWQVQKKTPTPKSNYDECESLWLFIELNKGLSAGPLYIPARGTVQQIANPTVDSI